MVKWPWSRESEEPAEEYIIEVYLRDVQIQPEIIDKVGGFDVAIGMLRASLEKAWAELVERVRAEYEEWQIPTHFEEAIVETAAKAMKEPEALRIVAKLDRNREMLQKVHALTEQITGTLIGTETQPSDEVPQAPEPTELLARWGWQLDVERERLERIIYDLERVSRELP